MLAGRFLQVEQICGGRWRGSRPEQAEAAAVLEPADHRLTRRPRRRPTCRRGRQVFFGLGEGDISPVGHDRGSWHRPRPGYNGSRARRRATRRGRRGTAAPSVLVDGAPGVVRRPRSGQSRRLAPDVVPRRVPARNPRLRAPPDRAAASTCCSRSSSAVRSSAPTDGTGPDHRLVGSVTGGRNLGPLP